MNPEEALIKYYGGKPSFRSSGELGLINGKIVSYSGGKITRIGNDSITYWAGRLEKVGGKRVDYDGSGKKIVKIGEIRIS